MPKSVRVSAPVSVWPRTSSHSASTALKPSSESERRTISSAVYSGITSAPGLKSPPESSPSCLSLSAAWARRGLVMFSARHISPAGEFPRRIRYMYSSAQSPSPPDMILSASCALIEQTSLLSL